jgi:hypothetical protein
MATLEELLQAINPANTYQRYIGQPFANVAGPFGRGFLGLQRPEYGSEEAYRTGQAVSNMPAAGIPAGAMKAAAQVPGLLADVVQAAKGSDELAGLLALTAYHGSPHRFSKFDASKIGTGEGAQAYGHGLYFAEAPGVAKSYQFIDASIDPEKAGYGGKSLEYLYNQSLRKQELAHRARNQKAIDEANAEVGFWESMMTRRHPKLLMEEILSPDYGWDAQAKFVKNLDLNKFSGINMNPGNFYTVDIPDEMIGKMLDYDKPLKDQPKEVKDFVMNQGRPLLEVFQNLNKNPTTKGFYKGIMDMPGKTILQTFGNSPETAQMLRAAGIPGIRYLDQGSRGAGTGTRNFVVFPGEEEAVKMMSVE